MNRSKMKGMGDSMNNQTLVSIITPSYNTGKYIRDTIESVLSQGYPHFEHIIYD